MAVADPFAVEVGDRIRLISMPNDPDPIPSGSLGTVVLVNPLHFRDKTEVQLLVKWDNGRSLSCICPPDMVEVVTKRSADETGDSGKVG